MLKKIKKWWDGEYIPYDNHPSSQVFIIGGFVHRHWTSKVAHSIVDFLGREWKWATGFAVAVAGLVMTYLRFF